MGRGQKEQRIDGLGGREQIKRRRKSEGRMCSREEVKEANEEK